MFEDKKQLERSLGESIRRDVSEILKQQIHLQRKQDQLVSKQDILQTTIVGDFCSPISASVMTSPHPMLSPPTSQNVHTFPRLCTDVRSLRSCSNPIPLASENPIPLASENIADVDDILTYLSGDYSMPLTSQSLDQGSKGLPAEDDWEVPVQSDGSLMATREGRGQALLSTQEGSRQPLLSAQGSGQALLAAQEGSRWPLLSAQGSGQALLSTQEGSGLPLLSAQGSEQALSAQEGSGQALLATQEGSEQALLAAQEGSGQALFATGEGSGQALLATPEAGLQTPEKVLKNNSHLWNAKDAGKLANKLARYAYFGDDVLASSTRTGKERNALDQKKVSSIHSDVHRTIFQARPLREFEDKIVPKINASLSALCRRLRYQKSLKNVD